MRGQEAVAVGVMRALEPDDAVVSTYREHGHALARGVSSEAINGGDVRARGRLLPRARLDADLAAELDRAVAFADASPLEPVEDLLKDVRGRSLCRTRSSP